MTKPLNSLGFGQFPAMALPAVVLPALLSLALLSGCGSQGSENAGAQAVTQSKVKVAKTMEDDPCALLPRQIVANQFSIPVDDIQQIKVAHTCEYSWKNKTDRMDVGVNISRIGDGAAETAQYFDQATRSMSGQDVSDAMGKVRAEAKSQGHDNALTEGVTGAIAGKGITFEDLGGLGDKARFQPAAGRVHVLVGNLYFEVTGYHGPKSPMPQEFNAESIRKSSEQWMRDTMPQRKEAAEKLAKAIIAGL